MKPRDFNPAAIGLSASVLFAASLWLAPGWSQQAESVAPSVTENSVQQFVNEPNDGRMPEQPRVQELSGEMFRIGEITVDKARRLISVPGSMLAYDEVKPIEFIATMRRGFKAYESVLSLDANAFEFNLACILIGLDAERARSPKYHFDPEPVSGDRVSIRVGWQQDGRVIERNIVELIQVDGKKPVAPASWIYTGSEFIEGDRYLAQMDGILIGLMHDPGAIIEHREGIGLNNWGAIAIDPATAPAAGQQVIVRIKALGGS